MSGKLIYILIAALILVGAGFYLYDARHNQVIAPTMDSAQVQQVADSKDATNETPASEAPAESTTPAPTPKASTQDDAPHYSDESDIDGSDVAVHEVSYDGTTFSPASLKIKVGDIVFFKNNATTSFRPASDPHPTHTNYPAFDSKSVVAAGDTFQFKFTKVGTWGYHDHRNPSAHATIIVTN